MTARLVKTAFLTAVALIVMAGLVTAQAPVQSTPADGGVSWASEFTHGVLASLLYSVLGLIVLFIGFKIFDAVTPFSLNKEIAEDQNVAAGVVVAGIMVALGMIIAAAIL